MASHGLDAFWSFSFSFFLPLFLSILPCRFMFPGLLSCHCRFPSSYLTWARRLRKYTRQSAENTVKSPRHLATDQEEEGGKKGGQGRAQIWTMVFVLFFLLNDPRNGGSKGVLEVMNIEYLLKTSGTADFGLCFLCFNRIVINPVFHVPPFRG